MKEVHSLFLMFYGSLRAMLEKEPSGGLIRSHLYPFIMDYLSGKLLAIMYLVKLCKIHCSIDFGSPYFIVE